MLVLGAGVGVGVGVGVGAGSGMGEGVMVGGVSDIGGVGSVATPLTSLE